MTNQELFTTTRRHLLTQNKRSIDPVSRLCKYRGPNGTKCAIGVHIPDDKYNTSLEGTSVYDTFIMIATGINRDQLPLAERLRQCHDHTPVTMWAVELAVIAETFNLVVEDETT